MRRGQDVGVLAIPFDLGCAGEPVAESENRLTRPAEIPAVDISVDSTGGQNVGVVGREVHVSDGPAVALERVLDGTIGRILSQIEVPDEAAVVGGGGHPVVTGSKRRPLDIDDQPGQAMATESAWWAVRRVQIDDGETFWP